MAQNITLPSQEDCVVPHMFAPLTHLTADATLEQDAQTWASGDSTV